jgi:hypothetical protein
LDTKKKACDTCREQRAIIGKHYHEVPIWRRVIGVILIYVPLFIMVPFVIVGSIVTWAHLRMLGAQNLKSYWEFVPKWDSHRYSGFEDQITMTPIPRAPWLASKAFWIFNCKMYCPMSVALFEWCAYLVKMVESWWCPFHHERKPFYADAPIDQSYWHVEGEDHKLHPEDRVCNVWYDETAAGCGSQGASSSQPENAGEQAADPKA